MSGQNMNSKTASQKPIRSPGKSRKYPKNPIRPMPTSKIVTIPRHVRHTNSHQMRNRRDQVISDSDISPPNCFDPLKTCRGTYLRILNCTIPRLRAKSETKKEKTTQRRNRLDGSSRSECLVL